MRNLKYLIIQLIKMDIRFLSLIIQKVCKADTRLLKSSRKEQRNNALGLLSSLKKSTSTSGTQLNLNLGASTACRSSLLGLV